MADVETFGVNLDILRLYIAGLPATLTSGTFPSSTQLPVMVNIAAGRWCARATQAGLRYEEAAAAPTSQGYLIMQDCIARSVAVQILSARERVDTALVERLIKEAEAAFALMTAEPGSAGTMQDTSEDGAFILNTHVTDAATAARVQSHQSLGVRLAAQGRL